MPKWDEQFYFHTKNIDCRYTYRVYLFFIGFISYTIYLNCFYFLEIAMLLPGSLAHSRTANNTRDIRKNLRLRDPAEYPQYDPEKT